MVGRRRMMLARGNFLSFSCSRYLSAGIRHIHEITAASILLPEGDVLWIISVDSARIPGNSHCRSANHPVLHPHRPLLLVVVVSQHWSVAETCIHLHRIS